MIRLNLKVGKNVISKVLEYISRKAVFKRFCFNETLIDIFVLENCGSFLLKRVSGDVGEVLVSSVRRAEEVLAFSCFRKVIENIET